MKQTEILEFSRTSDLYAFLREEGALEDLELFRLTDQKDIPRGNTGYVLLVDGEVAGAVSLYDEQDGGLLNELFEILPKYRGRGLSRVLYESLKESLQPDLIHGFATTESTRSLWEHLGQTCIDEECREMIEILDGRSVEEYLEDERPELFRKLITRNGKRTKDTGQDH
jgi:GNAT superfamily N-acetyltransferase